jgi:hypothetical protein
MKNDAVKMDIDLVYLWVDGNDPVWQAKKKAFDGEPAKNAAINCKGRYADSDELKYSLRSVEKYAPWIRKIFIVTDNQTPGWLNAENPKIKIIDHKDIMPHNCLPTFNSSVMEFHLYNIPDLAEHFLYANDDMFINKPVFPNTFFAGDGFPIIRFKRKPFRRLQWFWRERVRKKPLLPYSRTIANAAELVEKRYGIYYNGLPHHNIDAYLKSDCRRITEDVFKKELEAVFANRVRSFSDIQRTIYHYAALAEKRGHLRYTAKKSSFYARIHRENDYKKLEKYNPMLFCMNDSQYAGDENRGGLKTWLDCYFPQKSIFEK